MARIWYSVCGEGLGHALRSDILITHLNKHHDLLITAYGRAYPFLKKHHAQQTHKILGSNYTYEDNTVRVITSIINLLRDLPRNTIRNYKIIRPLIKKFNPDLIITDFESVSAYYGLIYNIPVINLDNIHALKECDIDYPVPWAIKAGIKILQPRGDAYVIPSFARAQPHTKKVHVVPPLIRESVRALTPSDKGHILIYQTSNTNNNMLPILSPMKKSCVIYGMGKRKRQDNLLFKDISLQGFQNDLSTASFVILNGGFTLISESLYLKKPILAIPVREQIEQEYNAAMIDHMGYGLATTALTRENLRQFEKDLPRYKKNLARIPPWDNKETTKILDRLIKEFS